MPAARPFTSPPTQVTHPPPLSRPLHNISSLKCLKTQENKEITHEKAGNKRKFRQTQVDSCRIPPMPPVLTLLRPFSLILLCPARPRPPINTKTGINNPHEQYQRQGTGNYLTIVLFVCHESSSCLCHWPLVLHSAASVFLFSIISCSC